MGQDNNGVAIPQVNTPARRGRPRKGEQRTPKPGNFRDALRRKAIPTGAVSLTFPMIKSELSGMVSALLREYKFNTVLSVELVCKGKPVTITAHDGTVVSIEDCVLSPKIEIDVEKTIADQQAREARRAAEASGEASDSSDDDSDEDDDSEVDAE
jgi:hypothetical protein